ncbi:hypothetical protein [Microbacterium sp. PRC9]|uniref:hypothetical protein n=1 Tax=Microbacterium sp. PRC9 TaxID=2962591 RepID=UPI0028810F2A|nr:hypothetical protein [Microbacterium sp. PRC9]MDT0141174.1 hypothetical protein [Microbacterium sp. PRC9]
MTHGEAEATASGGSSAPAEVGLWSERWFRVLTLLNVFIVIASACVWAASLSDALPMAASWLMFAVPVVPATVAMPAVSVVVVGSAAALSALNMFGERQKGRRFLRAMTVWGTIALGAPVAFAAVWIFVAAIGALR